MRTKVTEQSQKTQEIVEVRSVWSESDANALLATGKWRLLHGGIAHADAMGYQAKPVWVMGRLG